MSSGGKKQETVTNVQQSGPPSWAIPYYQSAINAAGSIASQPYTPYDGPRVAGFTGDQNAAMDMTRQLATNGGGNVSEATAYTQNLLNGGGGYRAKENPYLGNKTQVGMNKYTGANPYLNQLVSNAQQDVTNTYTQATLPNTMAQFNSSGAYGGTQMQSALSQGQQNLAQQLGEVSTNLRGQDYYNQQQLAESDISRRMQAQQTDLARNAGLSDAALGRDQSAWDSQRSRQLQAAGMAPGLDDARYQGANRLAQQGAVQQNWLQGLLDTDYGDFTEARDWQANRLGVLTNALGAIQGGTSSSQSTQANPNYRSAGQNAASYAAILASLYG